MRLSFPILVPALAVLILAAPTLSGCSGNGNNNDDGGGEDVIWNYVDGPAGPANWGSLSPEFAACSEGQEQSPIDITVDPEQDLPRIDASYREDGLDLENTGKMLIFHASGAGGVTYKGVDYKLKSIEFHVPAEHRYKGEEQDGEFQFYHESDDGHVLAVAVWMDDGVLNKELSGIVANAPLVQDDRVVDASIRVDPNGFLPESLQFYHYDGSLTHPPCTEGVTWFVLQQHVDVAISHLNFLRNVIGENSRPIQPLGGRTITQN
jgi:carbonic anhydrase